MRIGFPEISSNGKAGNMKSFVVTLLLVWVLIPLNTHAAAEFDSGEVVVVSLPVGDDLYIAGGKVLVSEPVKGDAIAAGGSVIINSAVGADLQAAGGSLIINAPVEDDLRAAGGDVLISSRIGGDLVVFGGEVTIPAGAVVQGDAVIGAGHINLGGEVRGDLRVQAGTIDLTGSVAGKAAIYAADRVNLNGTIAGETVFVGKQASLGPHARFGSGISYWRPEGELDFDSVPVGGMVSFKPELAEKLRHYPAAPGEKRIKRGAAAVFGGYFILTLLSGITVIILLTLLLKGPFRRAGEELHRSFWKSLGLGVLILILLPLVGLVCLATIVGIPVGIFALTLFLFSILFGRVIAAVAIAAWLERRRVEEWSTGRLMLISIGLYAVIKVVSVIPFIGWVAVLLAFWAAYGALVTGNWGRSSVI
jgi:hypothetical protein